MPSRIPTHASNTVTLPTTGLPAHDELLLRLLRQLSDHAVLLLDPAGTIVGWRGAAECILGYSEADTARQGRVLRAAVARDAQCPGAAGRCHGADPACGAAIRAGIPAGHGGPPACAAHAHGGRPVRGGMHRRRPVGPAQLPLPRFNRACRVGTAAAEHQSGREALLAHALASLLPHLASPIFYVRAVVLGAIPKKNGPRGARARKERRLWKEEAVCWSRPSGSAGPGEHSATPGVSWVL